MELAVSECQSLKLEPGAYQNGTNINLPISKDDISSYSTILFESHFGTKVVISGKGGTQVRLWAIYNSQGIQTRVSDAGADTLSSPLELVLSEENDEKYIVINVQSAYIDESYVLIKNPADSIITNNKSISVLNSAVNSYICDSDGSKVKVISDTFYTLQERGLLRVKFVNANTRNSSVTLKIGNADAKPLFYNGVAVNNTNTWDSGETVFIYYDGTNYQAWSIGRVNDLVTGGTKALTAEQGKILKQIIDNILQNVSVIENEIYEILDLTSQVTWTDENFIKAKNHIATSTTATNKVGVVSIPNGYNYLKFNFSVKKGSNYDKLGWFISDANNNVLLESDTYTSSLTVADTLIKVPIPVSAASLTISWDMSLESSQSVIVGKDVKGMFERVTALEREIEDLMSETPENVVNIENKQAKAYLKTQYNNGD